MAAHFQRRPQMMFIVYFQLVLTAVVTGLVAAFTQSLPAVLSTLGGAAVTLFNLWVLVFVWPRILANKKVALAVATIVFKFAILGLILYLVTHSPAISLGWFALGLGTVVPSVLVTAFKMPSLFPENAEASSGE
jgi:hypothetical protein